MIAMFETLGTQAQLKEVLNFAAEKIGNSGYKFEELSRAVQLKQESLENSDIDETELRLALWNHLQKGLGQEMSFPLAQQSLEVDTLRMGFTFAESTVPDGAPDIWAKMKGLWGDRSDCLAFEDALNLEASRLLGQLMSSGDLSDQEEAEIREQVLKAANCLDDDVVDDVLTAAIQKGDIQAIGAIIAGGSIAGLALAVELGGFAAYILAAKLSAFIPMVGGVGLVSALAVLVNPITVVGAVLGGGVFAWNRNNKSLAGVLARRLLVALALKGQDGQQNLLSDFRHLPQEPAKDVLKLLKIVNRSHYAKRQVIAGAFNGVLPEPYGSPRFGRDELGGQAFSGKKFSTESASAFAVGGIAIADKIYTAWMIDPTVLKAADFSRSEKIESVLDFSVFSQKWDCAEAASRLGFENNLQGYVAEQFVLARLVQAGHSVELPATSNMAGFDLIVDGAPVQVKCGQSLGLLSEHFEKYPDIPVIANSELVEKAIGADVEWLQLVHGVEGFGLDPITQMTQTSLESGVDLVENSAIMGSVFVTVGGQVWAYSKGQIPLHRLPTEIATEVSLRGGATWLGGLAGNAVGLLAFGPAGVVILGPLGGVAGLLGLSVTRGGLEHWFSPDWWEELLIATEELKEVADKALDRKIEALLDMPVVGSQDFHWLIQRRQDAALAATEARWDLSNSKTRTINDVLDVLFKIEDASLLGADVSVAKSRALKVLSEKPTVAEGTKKWAGKLNGLVRKLTASEGKRT